MFKIFNFKLGIVGGIFIFGILGIVELMLMVFWIVFIEVYICVVLVVCVLGDVVVYLLGKIGCVFVV